MLTPGRAAIVYHDGSGRGRASALVPQVRHRLESAGWQVSHEARTRYAGHAQRELAPDLAVRVDLIVVIGGDGMLREVAAGVSVGSTPTPLAVIPTGNGNVVARELGIPLDPRSALGLLTTGSVRKMDAGTVSCGSDGATHSPPDARHDTGSDREKGLGAGAAEPLFFMAMVEVGFGARIVHLTHRLRNGPLKPLYRVWGTPVYLAAAFGALASPREVPFTIQRDGVTDEGGAGGAIIANTKCYATDWTVASQAQVDDGWLDLVTRSASRPGLVMRSYAAAARSRPQPASVSRHSRGREFVFESERPMMIQVDGDPFPPTTCLRVLVKPGAVALITP